MEILRAGGGGSVLHVPGKDVHLRKGKSEPWGQVRLGRVEKRKRPTQGLSLGKTQDLEPWGVSEDLKPAPPQPAGAPLAQPWWVLRRPTARCSFWRVIWEGKKGGGNPRPATPLAPQSAARPLRSGVCSRSPGAPQAPPSVGPPLRQPRGLGLRDSSSPCLKGGKKRI